MIPNAVGDTAARKNIRFMIDAAAWRLLGFKIVAAIPDVAVCEDEIGGWDGWGGFNEVDWNEWEKVCCTDWNEICCTGEDKICCTDDCSWGAGWDAKKNAETDADDLRISDGADPDVEGVEISERAAENAETAADGFEISKRADGEFFWNWWCCCIDWNSFSLNVFANAVAAEIPCWI